MTDEQIIKALECCTSQDGSYPCTDCPCWDDDKSDCNGLDWKDVVSLVNRQKAEIERYADIGKMYSEVRAEAIREFADRLKRKSRLISEYDAGGWYMDIRAVKAEDIDNLVKEMTEGQL